MTITPRISLIASILHHPWKHTHLMQHLTLQSIYTSQSKSRTTSVSTLPRSPLAIPELLERILSYVDKRTLATGVILVSTLWRSIGMRFVRRTAILNMSLDFKHRDKVVLKTLPLATRLILGCPGRNGYVGYQEEKTRLQPILFKKRFASTVAKEEDLLAFQKRTLDLSDGRGNMLATASGSSFVPLLEFEVRNRLALHHSFLDFLPSSKFLTTLRIWSEGMYPMVSLSLSIVLEAYPNLTTLDLQSSSAFAMMDMDAQSAEEPPRKWGDTPLRLRTLELVNVGIEQSELERLLSLSPSLKELKLLGLRTHIGIHDTENETEQVLFSCKFDVDTFILHLRSLALPLRTFAFSLDGVQMTEGQVQAVVDEYQSTVREWGFSAATSSKLTLVPNRITVLELTSRPLPYDAGLMQDESVDIFLCNSPLLLHLKAPDFSYSIVHMDMHKTFPGLGTYYNYARPARRGQKWACKDLQTLSMSFCAHITGYLSTPLQVRILFGYLSRVCPKLKEFSTGATANIKMDLDAGFLLLGRLQCLERISFACAYRKQYGPSIGRLWAAIDPTLWDKVQRHKMVFQWQADLRLEQKKIEDEKWATVPAHMPKPLASVNALQAIQDRNQNQNTSTPSKGSSEFPSLTWMDTRFIGTLTDIRMALDDLDADPRLERWWPKLKSVRLHHFEKDEFCEVERSIQGRQPLCYAERHKKSSMRDLN